jgi:glutamate-1-semialdehyde 2,1-aminomutase
MLCQSVVTSAAHTDLDIEPTVAAVRGTLPLYRRPIELGSVEGPLEGRPVAPAIRQFAAPRRVLRECVRHGGQYSQKGPIPQPG